ncbi:MAG: Rpn family recombination-promoting nuclease/putative transposase [Eubacteriales bacterium]|nr:Rpn family recombination-promoting nuclease/putative transposase [Eubacteriales bacterium]
MKKKCDSAVLFPAPQNGDESLPPLLRQMSGPISFGLTNAYMFVAVLQNNQEALANLIAAILHIDRSEILSLEILNPIVLGEAADEKACVMDILVLLNGNIKINLEMQVLNEGNWNDRGVYYLAKNITDLKAGEDYSEMKTAIQVGILDFDLWKDGVNPFFQKYEFWDIKNNRRFTDKASIHVISLKQLENAEDEERLSGLYDWAKVFKTTTWEEMKALAAQNKIISDAATTMASLSEDERIKIQCLQREKAERDRLHSMRYAQRLQEQALKDGWEKGLEQGIEQGLATGRQEEANRLNSLIRKLAALGRTSDIVKGAGDPAYQAKLLEEFGL